MRPSIFLLILVLVSCGTERAVNTAISDNTSPKKETNEMEFYYSPNFEAIADQFLIHADSNNQSGFKNVLGEWVIPPIYTLISYTSVWSEGTLIVQKEGKLGAINIKNEVIIPFDVRWKEINTCKSGVFLVHTTDDQYTYISKEGKQLIPLQKKLAYPPYPRPNEFENGICLVGEERLNPWSNSHSINSTYHLVNNQFDTLYSFFDVAFKIKLGRPSEGLTPIYLYPDMKYGGGGVNYGHYGYINEKGEIAIEIQFSSEYFWGKQKGASVIEIGNAFRAGVAQNRFGDSIIYIDTLGNRVENALSYNKFGIGVKHSRDSIWIINKAGDTLLAAGQEVSLGGFGHSIVGGWNVGYIANDIIHLKNTKKRIQYYYSPDFKKLAEFDYSSRDSIYHQMTFTPSDQVLFGIETVARGTTSESLTSKRIYDHSGKLLASVIPPLVEVFPKVGCYIDYRPDSLGNRRCRLMNFEHEVLFEDSTLQIVSIGKHSHDYGLFQLEKRIETDNPTWNRFEPVALINFQGKIITKILNSFKNYSYFNVTNYQNEVENYERSGTVQLRVDQAYFFHKYKELKYNNFKNR